MWACKNRYDGSYLTARGFAGNGPAWNELERAALFEEEDNALQHAKDCGVLGGVRIVEVDPEEI